MQIVERDKRTDFTASSERCQQGFRGGIQIVKIADHRDPRTRGDKLHRALQHAGERDGGGDFVGIMCGQRLVVLQNIVQNGV